MQASIKDNVVFCKMCEAHNYKVIDYKTLVKEGKNHTQVIARCNECGTEFYFFTQITINSEKHYVFDEETAETKENLGMNEEMVTITKEEYDNLLDSDSKLSALEGAGVDNWEGYDYAMEEYEAEKEGVDNE